MIMHDRPAHVEACALLQGVPTNALHAQGYVSIGCEPCTRPVLPNQHEREGRWWWEVSCYRPPLLNGASFACLPSACWQVTAATVGPHLPQCPHCLIPLLKRNTLQGCTP